MGSSNVRRCIWRESVQCPTIHLAVASPRCCCRCWTLRFFHLSASASSHLSSPPAAAAAASTHLRSSPLIIYSLIHRRHDRLLAGRAGGLDSLRSDIVGPPPGKNPRVRLHESRLDRVPHYAPYSQPTGYDHRDGRDREREREKETIYLDDHPRLRPALVCHRRWKCDSAIMRSVVYRERGGWYRPSRPGQIATIQAL